MAQIPVERRPVRSGGGGAWWWVLVIAVIGLVVWLVYEWFDNDYYEDYGYVGTDAYIDDQGVTDGGRARSGMAEERTGPGGMGPMGNTDTLTTLAPVLDARDPATFDGADVRLQDLQVSQVHDDAATVLVEGQEVLVVFDGDARRSAGNLTEGSMLSIHDGELHAMDELGDPARYGLTDEVLQEHRFYVEADDLRMAG